MTFTHAMSLTKTPFAKNWYLKISTFTFFGVWIFTMIGTNNWNNWFLENTFVFLFLGFLFWSYHRNQFSDLSYLLITLYLCLHVYGAMYTYAKNPLGYWLQDELGWQRNHYDRIVHFSFGFLLTYPWREMFIRWYKFPTWVGWALPIELTLSISGFYELIEWAVADIFFTEQGAAFLGTQGDIWDAQKDIFLATLGAIVATTIVSSFKKAFRIY